MALAQLLLCRHVIKKSFGSSALSKTLNAFAACYFCGPAGHISACGFQGHHLLCTLCAVAFCCFLKLLFGQFPLLLDGGSADCGTQGHAQ